MTSDDMKALRKSMGHTQAELAKVLGVSRKTINEMENGANIDQRTKIALEAEARRVKLLKHSFEVEQTPVGSFAVIERRTREIERPHVMFYLHGETYLRGEFSSLRHAARWCEALQHSSNPRDTRELSRRRLTEASSEALAAS